MDARRVHVWGVLYWMKPAQSIAFEVTACNGYDNKVWQNKAVGTKPVLLQSLSWYGAYLGTELAM